MSLVDELDRKMLDHGFAPKRGKGKALFLAQLEEIKAAFNKGYSRIVIWQHLKESGKMPISYASFAAYMHQHIMEKEDQASTEPTASGVL